MSLKEILRRLHLAFFSKKVIPFALFYLGCCFFLSLTFASAFYLLKFFFPFISHTGGPFKNVTSVSQKIIAAIVVAPLLETFIFQYGVFQILKGRIRDSFIIFISALLFGISHFYDLFYILNTCLIGLVLAAAYKNWKGKKVNKFWMVVIIHATINIVVFLAS